MAALNCLQELKIRPSWTALSGLLWEAGHVLAANSNLQRPYTQLFDILILVWTNIWRSVIAALEISEDDNFNFKNKEDTLQIKCFLQE